MSKDQTSGIPPLDEEAWLAISIAEHQRRRTRMLTLRENSLTPLGQAAWEAAICEYSLEERLATKQARARSNPDAARGLLISLACKLRDGDSLSFEARRFLFDAISGAAACPDEATQRLGLILPHGKERGRGVEARNVALAFAVQKLRKTYPLSSGVNSAIGQVAVAPMVSESKVRDAYNEFRKYAEFAEEWAAQDILDGTQDGEKSNTS
ncbi:MAG TPA: hypothetical protein VLF18_07580 [Tahibacter sp.]|uniref:hypothetical protein n=1 Tax=Tahibacter sp. TaxID=2056211 RepID=UPI002CFDF6E1|nr:hypothetical protein [Tahibacter sp.]HSX60042.1 hypothetical protein [Tahibacter sp.]